MNQMFTKYEEEEDKQDNIDSYDSNKEAMFVD